MAAIVVPRIESEGPELVAPWWHTALLTALFLGMAVGGAFFQRHARSEPGMLQQHPRVVPLYLSLIAMEWGLFYYVWKGLRSSGTKLRDLIGGQWKSARDVVVDAGLAVGLWAVWIVIEKVLDRWFGAAHAASIKTLLPQRAIEIFLWIGVCISAGFCEELVFRGYFQKQFEGFTHSRWIALVLQSLLFGIAHGYQGIQACVIIVFFGLLYGLVALWRKSLRPGMMAHAFSDILSGIFGV
jgi:uncharacterized protein